ncbi:2'-5' RNA ligase family protein [Candidatus Pacearchaeota archaeon]|nr:2'-5' RNA ligase family protein [Candidatus Pacearchaeota archaeon]
MNYRIVYLLKGESKRYAEKLIEKVAKKFNVNFVYSGKQPAHITLKYRFETDKIKEVENKIRKICEETKSSSFEIGGLSNFKKHALILKVRPSKEMVKFEKKLLKRLNHLEGDLAKFDKVLYKNFHVGIAHHDIEEKFEMIRNYLKKYDKNFKVKFDKIYLIRKPKNKWIVQKTFDIK